jgi:peptide/nickel transport system permease protein
MSTTVAIPAAAKRGENQARRALRRFLCHRLAVFGLAVIVVLVATALLALWVAPYDPLQTS